MATVERTAQGYRLGFESQNEETSVDQLPVSGSIPAWLSGTLVRTGPAKFEVGERSFNHWFDGLAMLHSFALGDARVSYANRFLQTRAYKEATDSGRIGYSEFATDPCRTVFQRFASTFSPKLTDNASVNVVRLGDEYLALTETPLPVEFEPGTLRTLGVADWSDGIPGQVTTAHPHHDSARGELINYAAHLGPVNEYRVYAKAPGGKPRRISSLRVRKPAYMHSFAITERYVVLVEFPLVVNPLALALSGRPFIENYRWEPDRGTVFNVIDRVDGSLRARVTGPAFFGFHHVNAFEDGDQVLVDVCAYRDASIVEALYLDRLRSGAEVPHAELWRYRVPLGGGDASGERLADEPMELPRINYRSHNGRRYRFVYGTGPRTREDFLGQLVKADLEAGESVTWSEDDCYPGEPVFVPEPGGEREDDGVVLSVVLDARSQSSFLVLLDASSFEELARAQAPLRIPFGFHGSFFRE